MAQVRVDLFGAAPAAAGYDVHVGEGLLDSLASLLARTCPAHRYALIADDRVATLHGERLRDRLDAEGLSVDLVTFPAGEAHKSRTTWIELTDRLLDAGHGRDSAVLALGGGVTGDLAGFTAATYLRGLPLVQLPTSLLAMIDSAVGGKTGVDTPAGKNLVGSFHQPRLVVADTATLRTLPPAEVRAGLAEAVKHGAIADEAYFAWISRDAERLLALDTEALARLIARSVEIKAEVVRLDEKEGGLRKTLNFGHTIGHAVEAASRFELLHGEAIAIGMVVEARIGERLGITRPGSADRLRDLLSTLGLPTGLPAAYPPADILALTRVDKKARSGRVEYALIERIGAAHPGDGARWSVPVDDAAVLEVMGDG